MRWAGVQRRPAAKRRIVEGSFAGHRQASATARRHGLSPSLLFAWRQAYRAGELGGVDGWGFVPVVVACDQAPLGAGGGQMEIVLGDGCRVVVSADVDGAALGRVLQALERRCSPFSTGARGWLWAASPTYLGTRIRCPRRF